jgi:hypothetical protein
MGKDIIIGKGDYGCSAWTCFNIKGKHSISENKVSYWIHRLVFNQEMKIFKNTKEGQKLTLMIETNESLDNIMEYLNNLVFKHISLDTIINYIEVERKNAYDDGRKSMQKDLCKLLGVL